MNLTKAMRALVDSGEFALESLKARKAIPADERRVGRYMGYPVYDVTNPDFRVYHGTQQPWKGDEWRLPNNFLGSGDGALSQVIGPHATSDPMLANKFAYGLLSDRPRYDFPPVGSQIRSYQPQRFIDIPERLQSVDYALHGTRGGFDNDSDVLDALMGRIAGMRDPEEMMDMSGGQLRKLGNVVQQKLKDQGIDGMRYVNTGVEVGNQTGAAPMSSDSFLLMPHTKAGFCGGGLASAYIAGAKQ